MPQQSCIADQYVTKSGSHSCITKRVIGKYFEILNIFIGRGGDTQSLATLDFLVGHRDLIL
jgi:hypothetical protein